MTRVLQVMAGAAEGGAEAFFVRLVAALARAGVDQRAAIRRNPKRAAALTAAGVPTVELSFGGWFDFTTKPALRRILAAEKPDIAMTWMSRATSMLPRSAVVHVARLGGYYDAKHYAHCDHLVANTRDIAAYLARAGFPESRIHYLPNFIDAAAAAPVPRASLTTPEGAPLVLAMGRLHRNKAFDVLLQALVRLDGAWLWLAGAGPEESVLCAQAQALGIAERVRFLGWRDDGPALLAAADLLVCPSRHEPLGNVVIEAWAAGRPVVAAASAGPRQLIVEGVSGLLVPVGDGEALAQAIGRVLSEPDLTRRLIDGGRAAWAEEFTEAKVIAAYRALFDRIAC